MPAPKKIVIVDDHDAFRLSLKQIIGTFPGCKIAGEASDARQGEAVCREVRPDLTVVDLSLPDKSGIQLSRILKAIAPENGIVIVSMHSKIDYVLGALQAGALAYLVKESVARYLIDAFTAVLRNEYFLDPALSQELAPRLLETAEAVKVTDTAYGNLTAREQEIFRLLARGIAVMTIAETLSITAKTVNNHRSSILSKLDLHNTVDLVRYAVKIGLIDDFDT